jgi:CHAD domain-containing protein
MRHTMMWTELLPTSMAAMRMRYTEITRRKGRQTAHATTPVSGLLARALDKAGRTFADALGLARQADEDGVHDARVACRRLRESLAVVEAADLETGRLGRRLRRLARAMGPVRELDVARHVLDELAAIEPWPPVVVAAVDAACQRRRARAARTLGARLDRFDDRVVIAAVAAIGAAVERDEAGRAWATSLAQRVRKRAAGLVHAIDAAGTLYVAEPLHDIRLAVKKLRYVLEFVPSWSGWRPGVARGRLRRAQTAFGALSDLQLVQGEVQRLAARSGGARGTREALARMDRDLEARCRAAHAEILKSLPALRVMAARLARAGALEAVAPRAARMTPPPLAGARRHAGERP